ncbi:hypothetical protein L7F22_058733 [Adiantum nelumboides]|nr:hypothetical protein [Adiantum nelumboides]
MKGKKRLFPKLDLRYYGPFQVCDKISDVAYRLKLPEGWKIHNAFHVSLLRPFVGNVPEDMVPEEQREVEELDEILVLAHKDRKVKGKVARRYLVKFKNYSPMDAKWMEEAKLVDSPQLLHDDRTGPPSGRSNKRRDFERDGRAEPRSKGRYDDRPKDDYRGRRNDSRHFESSQAGFRSKAADDAWSHDKFLESQAEDLERKRQPTVPPERTRQSGKREFRETPPLKAEIVDEGKSNEADRRPEKRLSDNNDKRTERGFSDANLVQRDRNRNHERAPESERGRWMDSESSRGRFNPRRSFNRYNGDGDRGGGLFDSGRRNSGGHGTATDRWHHDMFEELSQTPTLKKEEDSVAQIEALLAT